MEPAATGNNPPKQELMSIFDIDFSGVKYDDCVEAAIIAGVTVVSAILVAGAEILAAAVATVAPLVLNLIALAYPKDDPINQLAGSVVILLLSVFGTLFLIAEGAPLILAAVCAVSIIASVIIQLARRYFDM